MHTCWGRPHIHTDILHNNYNYKTHSTHAGGGKYHTMHYNCKTTKHTTHKTNTQYTIYSTHAGGGEYHTLHTSITSITHCTIHTNSEHKCTKIHTAHCTQMQMQCTFTLFSFNTLNYITLHYFSHCITMICTTHDMASITQGKMHKHITLHNCTHAQTHHKYTNTLQIR